MRIVPTGYQVLIELRNRSQTVKDGALEGFVLNADNQHEIEQDGEPLGKVLAFGPLAFHGFKGCDSESAEERAKQWGIQAGDMAIFSRYAGLLPLDFKKVEEVSRYRLVPDKEILGRVESIDE